MTISGSYAIRTDENAHYPSHLEVKATLNTIKDCDDLIAFLRTVKTQLKLDARTRTP